MSGNPTWMPFTERFEDGESRRRSAATMTRNPPKSPMIAEPENTSKYRPSTAPRNGAVSRRRTLCRPFWSSLHSERSLTAIWWTMLSAFWSTRSGALWSSFMTPRRCGIFIFSPNTASQSGARWMCTASWSVPFGSTQNCRHWACSDCTFDAKFTLFFSFWRIHQIRSTLNFEPLFLFIHFLGDLWFQIISVILCWFHRERVRWEFGHFTVSLLIFSGFLEDLGDFGRSWRFLVIFSKT